MKKLIFLTTFTGVLFFFLLSNSCFAKQQMTILVHSFENTGNKEYSWISAGMTDTVIADLAHIQDISVVSNQDRKKALEEMKFAFSGLAEEDKMIKLGKLTGANVIFTGSYFVSGNRIRIIARLVNVETGKVESSTKLDGTIEGIFDLQDKVVFALMGETEKINIANIKPVNLTEQDKKKIEEKPKPKSTAYEWYAKGLEVQDTNPKEALTDLKTALDIDPNYTDALMMAGRTAGNTLSLFTEAFGYFEKAERIFKSRNETTSVGYAMFIINIGTVYIGKGQPDRALEYYLKSQSIYESLGLQNTAGYAGLMANIGTVYHVKGQPDRVLEYYLNSQSIYESLGLQNTAGYAGLMANIGNIYGSRGQLDRALEYYLKSQSIYESLRLQNTASYAGLIANIGNVYSGKGQPDRALEYYLKFQFIMDRLELQNTADYARNMTNIGTVYSRKSQFDRALEYYLKDKSIEDALGLQNTDGYANVMVNIGTVYSSKGQLDRALEYYLNSKTIKDRLGLQNTANYASIMMNMAVLYETKGHRDMAGKYYRMAYDIYVRSDYSGELRDKALDNAKRLGY
jgi:tetratricopeptide (TPR) repeat protein/TolB-like protein